ncbi:hypothetical protein C8R46DRAFT_1223006 [Mycena filopes]|nr:hypothetical protein C8R46DRAFT_1223006 [Mycena filopes]
MKPEVVDNGVGGRPNSSIQFLVRGTELKPVARRSNRAQDQPPPHVSTPENDSKSMELNFHCTPPPYTHLLPVYMQSHSPENGTIDPAQLLAPAQTSPYLSPTLSDDLADTDDSLFDGVDGLGVKTEPLTLSPGDPFFYQSDPLDIDMDALDSLARHDDIACGSDDEDEEEIDELASSIPATPVRPPVCPPSPPSAPISPLPTLRTSPSYPALVEYSRDEDSEDETPRR